MTLPQDLDAERSVIGAIILTEKDPDALEALDRLRDECWANPVHMRVARALRALHSDGKPMDVVSLRARLQETGELESVGGTAYLVQIEDYSFTAANVSHHADLVWDCYIRREVIRHGTAAVAAAQVGGVPASDIAENAARAMADVVVGRSDDDPVNIYDLLKAELPEMEARGKGERLGLSTGFDDLDKMLGGLTSDDLLTIAARPAMGKSALAMNIAENVAIRGRVGVLVVSLEMSKEMLIRRVICSEAGVDGTRLRDGNIAPHEYPKIFALAGKFKDAPLWIDDDPTASVAKIRAKARRLKSRGNLGLVIVDYMQLMSGSGKGNRENDVSEMSRGLKNMGKEIGCSVIALSQLNRGVESRQDKRPILSDLRESGSIEQDSSKVIFVYRHSVYDPTASKKEAEIVVRKNRNGSLGTVHMGWKGAETKFVSVDQPAGER